MSKFNRTLYQRGKRAEYKVIKLAEKYGYICIRSPASGAGAKKVMFPDVVCVNPKVCDTLAIEVKYTKKLEVRYLNEHQYESLKYWRSKGARAFVVIVFEGGYMVAVPFEKLVPHYSQDSKTKYVAKVTAELMKTAKKFEDVLAEAVHRALPAFLPEKDSSRYQSKDSNG
jgi:Holliday junction resolvase